MVIGKSQLNLSLIAALLAVCSFIGAPAFSADVLRGKVQKADQPVRIQRPGMPSLSAHDEPLSSSLSQSASRSPITASISEGDFVISTKKQNPSLAPLTFDLKKTPFKSDTEDADLLIEWEQWHHRVSEAIFQRWRTMGVFPGIARTTLTFNRDGRVVVDVKAVELPPNIYAQMMPQYRSYGLDEIKHLFAEAVENSVMPLNGSSTVQFPEKSKRQVVVITPNFAGDTEEGYNWKHGDCERVRVK